MYAQPGTPATGGDVECDTEALDYNGARFLGLQRLGRRREIAGGRA
jgi:hypothetical protein